MSFTIANTGAPALHGLGARALRAVAVVVLAIGLQVPATVAAAGSPDDSISPADRAPIAAVVAHGAGSGGVQLQADDGEDHFDEGDDEFDCDNINEGEDPCEDNPEDRFDAGDDEYEDGCANFDDGEDRCLDDGEDRFDEGDDEYWSGDDEYEAGCADFDDGEDRCLDDVRPGLDQPIPSHTTTNAATVAASPDRSLGLAALASLITLGAGSLWFLRRGHR